MLKKLVQHVGEYKRPTFYTPLFVAGECALDIIIPLVIAMLIDRGIEKGDQQAILFYGAILLVCALLALVLGTLSGRFAAIASAGFAKNLRGAMFRKIQSYSFSNIDRFSTNSLVTRLTTDVTNVQNAYQMVIRMLIRSPLMLIFSLIMAFSINAELASTFLIVLPILAVGLFIVVRIAHPLFEKVFRIYDKMNNVVQENLQGIRVVKSYVREKHEGEKFENVSAEIFNTFSKAERTVAFNAPLLQFCMYATMLLLSWLGAHLVVDAQMTTGELVSMFTYAMQTLMSLNMLSMIFVMILIARASGERIVEVLDEESDLANNEKALTEISDGAVEFKDVCFSYANDPEKLALKHVSFKAEAGEVIGVIGGTGSSKSTLVQLIPRLYDATSGEVLVGGVNVKDYDLVTLRDNVSMVLQNNVLFSGTIASNLRWGDENASEEEIEKMAKISQADPFIQEFPEKYQTPIAQGGSNVSGGQKQRLTIARALLKKPKILILDDSTSAVDTKTDTLIRQGLKKEIPGTTTFIIAQRISSVSDADKIIVMDKGMIHGIGTHDELLKENAIYQEIYDTQQKGFGSHEAN
ncbi:ABC transporter ATP-binding protein [Enterococcus mediterraneensis]|uniref:ABC transporter ATP-binding protein n=1 Tax=Enterococcus mediterraneensis TaxID=2364791 RepID=UPI000F068C52|nr:ABC transporter ATP-binding protein [Enterococcus mediterraneensis]